MLSQTRLEKNRTSRVYRDRLLQGRDLLLRWLFLVNLRLTDLVQTPLLLDASLAEFVNYCQHHKVQLWLVRHSVLYIQTQWRNLRHCLPRAWDCISSWSSELPTSNRKPVPHKMLLALSVVALSWGYEGNQWSRLLIIFSVLVRIGFFSMLRTGELLRLRVVDICVDATEQGNVVIGIRKPKNRKFMGRNQFALLEDRGTIAWLKWLIADLPSDCPLWPSNAAIFRSMFRRILSRIGLDDNLLTAGCLRPGGVTFAVLEGMEVARVKFRARWKSEASLAAYIQEAVSQQVWLGVPSNLRQRVHELVQGGAPYLSTPPSLPWRSSRFQ